jgi:uncharacterized membrane protein SpoIIM required for sporulation
VNLDAFLAERRSSWDELEALLREARKRPERLGPARVLRLGTLYRGAAADLALARRRYAGDQTVVYLDDLVGRARHVVYDAPTKRASFVRFFRRDYWQLVVARPLTLVVAAVLVFGPAFLAAGWALRDPGSAGGLVPGAYRSVTEPRPHGSDIGLTSSEQAQISSRIFTNNIEVTFLAFAGGILLGVGTAFLLVVNGVLLGTVAGLAIGSGNGRVFFELVTAHGVLELSCILVGGAAGLRVGWAIVDPGRLARRRSLQREARRAVLIAVGTAPWLVVAGIVEGNRANLAESGLGAVIAVGAGLGALYWGLVFWRGRARRVWRESARCTGAMGVAMQGRRESR